MDTCGTIGLGLVERQHWSRRHARLHNRKHEILRRLCRQVQPLQRLLVHLHDGHAQVFYRAAGEMHAIPLLWGWIENHIVITRVAPQVTADVHPGDSVIEVDGKPATEVLTQAEALVSGALEVRSPGGLTSRLTHPKPG